MLAPQPQQATESNGEQTGNSTRANAAIPGHEHHGRGADGGTEAVAQTDGGLMNTTVLALGIAGVHGVKERGVINQANRQAKNDLSQKNDDEAGGDQNGSERD